MAKCADPICTQDKSEKVIDCSSPFRQLKFHLSCELNSIYFLCNACKEFIQYSNSGIEGKIINLENKMKELLNPIELKLMKMEIELKESVNNLSNRLDSIDIIQSQQRIANTDTIKRLSELESEIDTKISNFKEEMSLMKKTKHL